MATVALRESLFGRVSWGALFAGFFFGFAIWLLLLALGGGIGFSSFDATDVQSWQHLGIGFGIWGVIAGIVALFVAGWITARLGAVETPLSGMLHGAALWGFMLVTGLWLATMAVAGTAATAAQAAGGAAQAAGSAAGNAAANPQNREQMQQQGQALESRAQGLAQQAQQNAPAAAEKAKTAGAAGAWAFFVFGVLTLAAAILGGRAGAPRFRRELPSPERVPAHGAAPAPQRA